MVAFFFVIGLEVRREFSLGELTNRRRIVVPMVAGVAEMALPALLYLLVNPSGEGARGWGVVIGTDTAFLLGALALVGPTFSTQLRIFLLTLTVIDDILAVTVIGDGVQIGPLMVAAGCLVLLLVVESGVHASIAGMLAGLLIPAYSPRRQEVEGAASLVRAFRQSPLSPLADEARVGVLLAAVLATLVAWLVFWLAAVLRGERTAELPRVLAEPVDPARDHLHGPVDAALTLVEYLDYEWPFCARTTGVTRELCERFGADLRYVVRHLPLPDVHPHAELAAVAAEAASVQGKFWQMHEVMFAHQDELELEDLVGYVATIGLDVEQFLRDLDDDALAVRVRQDAAGAEASGARGTPTFFVGDRRHVGPHDAGSLTTALELLRGSMEPTAAG